jgi:hypothetical protein
VRLVLFVWCAGGALRYVQRFMPRSNKLTGAQMQRANKRRALHPAVYMLVAGYRTLDYEDE